MHFSAWIKDRYKISSTHVKHQDNFCFILKLFQKIANASRCEGIVLPHMRDDSGKKRLPDRFPEQSIKKERLTEYDRFLDDYK